MMEVKHMTQKLFVVALAILFGLVPLLSEENKDESRSPQLKHEIVVTATRVDTPAKEVASSFTILSAEELEKTGKSMVIEVLEEVLGVSLIQNGGKGGSASVFLRGANSEHTLILVDGIEMNDPVNPSRSFDLAHFPLDNVERIEVLLGPQSTLYGSDAIGGIIHIITRKGEGKAKFSFASEAGSFGTLSIQAGMSGALQKAHYSLGISRLSTRGISAASSTYLGNEERDGYRNFSLSGRVGYQMKENIEMDFIIRSIDAKTDIDNFGGAYGDDPNHVQEYTSLFVKGQIRALTFSNRWEQKWGFGLTRSDRRHRNPEDTAHPSESEDGRFESTLLKLDLQNNFFLHETNTLTFGIEYEQEQGESEYLFASSWGSSSSQFPRRKASTIGFYLQDQVRLSGRFFASGGIRADIHNESGQALTFRLAPAYIIPKTGTKLKATYGTGFKSPSLYQLYAPRTAWGAVGNPTLKAEECAGWDAGIEQPLFQDRLLVSAVFFSNTYRNLISFDFQHGYVNIGRAFSRGVELSLEAKPWTGFLLRTSFTLSEAKDRDNETPLLRRPGKKLVATLSYAFAEGWEAGLSYLYVGERDDIDFSTWPSSQVTLPGYSLLNAFLSCSLSSGIQLIARLDNIFDEQYETVLGYGTPGFSVYGGIRISF